MRRVVKFGIGLVAIAGVGLAVVKVTGADPTAIALPQSTPPPAQGVVAALSDGETFDIRSNDQLTRIRLLSIDTPAPATPDRPAQCLGPEATAYLASVIPVGTTLQLTYDKDRFGRTVAMASTPDGRLVNAEVVRAGFAEVIKTDEDGPTQSPVEAASREASTSQRGLHSPDVGCTVPGQVKAVTDMVARVPTTAPAGARGADLNNSANAATDARAAADELLWAFDQKRQEMIWLVLEPAERAKLEQQTRDAHDRVAAAEVTLRTAASATFNSEATQGAVQAEAARVAKQLAAIRAAEARRAAEAARRAEAARQAAAAKRAEADAAQQAAQDEAAKKAKKKQQDGTSGSDSGSNSSDSGSNSSGSGSSSSGSGSNSSDSGSNSSGKKKTSSSSSGSGSGSN
jgi:micrococcal nuclease